MSAQVPAPAPANVKSGSAPEPLAAWTPPVQGTVAFCIGLGLLTLGAQSFLNGYFSVPTQPAHETRIHLNRASHADLMLLPGVGDQLARRIEEHRRQQGPFRTVDDLRKVSGIGPTILERLRPLVTVNGLEDGQRLTKEGLKPLLVPPADAHSPKKAAPGAPLDLNSASLEDLDSLPGIGKVLAQRIVEEREKKAFTRVEDLRRVKGIGVKTLEKLRPLVKVGSLEHVAPAKVADASR